MEKYPVEELVDQVLGECRLLMTISGILFGFLLNVSVFKMEGLTPVGECVLTLALTSSAVSVLIFLLPAIYHHTRSFPLTTEEAKKVYIRSHRFIVWGLSSLILTIYFSLLLVFHTLVTWYAFIIVTAILAVPAMLFKMRKTKP
jgi:hypothetical protein